MWFLRAIMPVGAAANIVAILWAAWMFSADPNPPFTRFSGPTIAIYLLCMAIPLKESLGLAIIGAILSSAYFLLTRHFPVLDFAYSGYAFVGMIAIPLMVIGAISGKRENAAVKAYFLRRQMGTGADLVKATGLSEKSVQTQIEAFLESGELAIVVEKPPLYRWTEDRHYPEGVQSTTLEISV